jgi:hypothetical protein
MSNVDHIYYHDNSGITGSFSDPRVILVRLDDERLVALPNLPISCQQADDGPSYLVISPAAPDDALERASARFGIPVQDMQQFRAEVSHV